MNILWTDEALDDFEEILVYYHSEAGPLTAEAVHSRIVAEIEALRVFPERIRASARIPGVRELVVRRLPYVALVQVTDDAVVVLNVVHTAREFPARH
ncbi:type II toxin-antitoxin system RelE/ParE family toxin [Thauera sp. WH-1]|uniref:type II toxin-antitoxin system RelE/ParE family toxin n=1 Tax=Thauera sp. WH-1 TaxID=3398230 RepID=UPI0039FCBD36